MAVAVNQGDNSNTQFAVLGLWVAMRHAVPVQAGAVAGGPPFPCVAGRDGSWTYNGASYLASMTCSGLLALAVGHGVNLKADANKKLEKDEAIQKGFR